MTYTLNTQLRMTERPNWLGSTRNPVTVLATIVSARETPKSGVLYGLEFIATKPLNNKYVTVTRFLFERELKGRVTEVVTQAKAKKPRQRKPKAQLKAAA